MMKINLIVNGKTVKREVDENLSLLRFLREELGLVGTKNGCEKGHCGSCTIIFNGDAKRSCIIKMKRAQNAIIETIEGIYENENLNYIQQAFIDEGAVQCGFCTPGMIMATKALLDKVNSPSEEEIKEALKNNMCRCTGYTSILRAVKKAVKVRNEKTSQKQRPKNNKYIGSSVIRKDVYAKVKGEPVFADDYSAENMLIGKMLFSAHAHAKILSIDTKKAEESPGVALVLTGKDVPGRNAFGLFQAQQPVIAKDEVRYLGEVVAVVYAETREEAEYARDLIEVEYEVLPSLTSPIAAMEEDAPLVHEDRENNIVHYVKVRKGNIEDALEKADVVIEGYYTTSAVEHAYLEPEACIAKPNDDGGITI